jgi:hypothetical protein
VTRSWNLKKLDFMHMKTKEPGWRENHGIQNICIEDSQKNIRVDQRQVQKIWTIIVQGSMIELVDQETQKLKMNRKQMQMR